MGTPMIDDKTRAAVLRETARQWRDDPNFDEESMRIKDLDVEADRLDPTDQRMRADFPRVERLRIAAVHKQDGGAAMSEQIDDKMRATVMRELRNELGDRMIDGDWLGKCADTLDPPEFEDGNYDVWRNAKDGALIRHIAERCDGRWHVSGIGSSYRDEDMRTYFSRIERLRTAAADEVIVKREDAKEAAETLRRVSWRYSNPEPHPSAARIFAALNEQTGGER